MSEPIESWAIELWSDGDAKAVRLNRSEGGFVSLSLVEIIYSDRGFVNVSGDCTEELQWGISR